MKVFVTGATGFIGKNTVKRLIESRHECICLVRGFSKKDALEKIGCQFVTGDITDRESLTKGMRSGHQSGEPLFLLGAGCKPL